jgi:acyl carrier protein
MIIDTVRSIVRDEILNNPDLDIGSDQDLLLTEMLNSLSVTLLVARLESIYEIDVPPEDVTLENFGTLANIADYIESLRSD